MPASSPSPESTATVAVPVIIKYNRYAVSHYIRCIVVLRLWATTGGQERGKRERKGESECDRDGVRESARARACAHRSGRRGSGRGEDGKSSAAA